MIGCKERVEARAERCLSYLPSALAREITQLCRGRAMGLSEIREISVRRGARCSLRLLADRIPLYTKISAEEMDGVLMRLCGGSLYAHRDNISEGYIPIGDGIRVGICGLARYEGLFVVGVSETSGFVFRIPGHECAFSEELFALWESGVRTGMLIYSPPGVGKTTALRALAGYVSSGRGGRRVAVVDERCEFIEGDYENCEVDILRGYKKRQGIEIAARTLSPEVIMVDEVGGGEAEAMLGVIRCGVPIVATTHGASLDELSTGSASTLIDSGVFDLFVGISGAPGRYCIRVDRA